VREKVRRKDARVLGLDVENESPIPDVVVVAKDG